MVVILADLATGWRHPSGMKQPAPPQWHSQSGATDEHGGRLLMKATIAGLAVALLIGTNALTQTGRPAADPLAVTPIPSQAQVVDADVIRAKIEQAGYTDVSE
jgi:hypothetical protein